MIEKQYGNSGAFVPLTKTGNDTIITNVKTPTTKSIEKTDMSSAKVDRFEHGIIETAETYSPAIVGIGTASVNSIMSTTSQATTAYQRRIIPKLLAAKMASVRTYSNGDPIIGGAADAAAYMRAQNTIHGDHANLSYRPEYCYSQTGYTYGNPEPRSSCCTFAFATALSIKYGTQITPDRISTVPGHGYVDNNTNTDVWTTTDGRYTAYKIVGSSGSETLSGIDAQLQLGNPVLIHTSGYSVNGTASEHWATVIGKQNGRYRIIDPWDGTERWLEDMEIYKNNGSILEYTILSDRY